MKNMNMKMTGTTCLTEKKRYFVNLRRFFLPVGAVLLIGGLADLVRAAKHSDISLIDRKSVIMLVVGAIVTFAGIRTTKGYFKEYVFAHKALIWFTVFSIVLLVLGAFTAGTTDLAAANVIAALVLLPVSFFLWLGAALSDDVKAMAKFKPTDGQMFINLRRWLFVLGIFLLLSTVFGAAAVMDMGVFSPVPFFSGIVLIVLCFGSLKGEFKDFLIKHKAVLAFTAVLFVLMFVSFAAVLCNVYGKIPFDVLIVCMVVWPFAMLFWLAAALTDDIKYIIKRKSGEI